MAALIHLWAMPEHLAAWWGYGAFFIATALGQGLYGVALLRRPAKPLLLVGIAGNLAIVAFYLAVHTDGMPYFGPLAGEVPPANSLGVVCVAVELALVLMLAAQAGVLSPARSYVAFGAAQAFGVGLILHLLHAPLHEAHGPDPLFHWLSDSALALPFSVLAVWAASPVARGIIAWSGLQATGQAGTSSPRLAWALTAAAVYAAASVPAGGLAARHPEADAFSTQASRDAGVTLAVGLLLLLAVAMARGAPWEELKAIDLWRPRVAVVAAGAVTGLAAVLGPTALEGLLVSPAVAQQTAGQCNATTYDRSYDVASIDVEIPYNRWGKSDPDGQVFVLQGDKLAVKSWHEQLGATPAGDPAGAGNRRLRPRPLILRANAGECVKIDFTNELDDIGGDGLPNEPRASMKVFGLAYDAQASDGSAVGYNADTTVPNRDDPATPKQENSISYYWKAPQQEGAYHFRDQGASAGSEADGGSTSHGLYGAFVVEPAGSDWTDPETGDPLYEGSTPADHERVSKESGDPYIDADVKPAQGAAFRETVQISQDELPGGNGFAFNYGAEPGSNRIADNPAGNGIAGQAVPDGIGEETSLSSWAYGDPALVKLASGKGPWLPEPDPDKPGDRISAEDCGLEEEPGGSCYVSNVTHAYPGDPTKIRYAHAGVKETHVFHMHAHQWLAEPNDTGDSGAPAGEITDANRPDSTTIDSQTYGPGESFTADLLYGAGSKPGTFGDSIFHCHLYPHFADGFWALFRVHDVREDGSGETPDGIKVRNLEPLSQAPPQPTADNPGYPRFIPGKFGWRAPQPPGGLMEPSDQPDDPNTLEREDLQPATRVVAGKPLDATLDLTDPIEKELAGKLAVEGDVQDLDVAPKPGAPFADPCPTGAREVTYNVSVIQADVVYNEDGWHDTQGRILVPDKDVEDVLAGREQPEPLFIRVNAGDCVNFNLTNRLPNWFGNDAFVELTQTNMAGEHIHLVKFDVLGSDGSSNGWNYQQAAFSKEQADFNKDLDAEGNVKDCDADGCRVPDPATWDPSTQSASNTVGQTISERWYADYELRTVFTHDHHFPAVDQNRGLFGALLVEPGGMDFRDPGTGEFFQPVNSDANGASCGDSCEGTAAGTAMDVIGPGANDDFREFGLAIQDFVSLTKAGGDPASKADTINPPNEPETFPNDDPGTMAINYRNAPFVLRQEKNGNATNPAHVFSSTVHGDPKTPILEAYSEDPVRIRTIQGSQEEQHVMSVHGMRWREEPDDPQSPLINSKAIGISEAFNFEVPRMTCGPGDTACTGDYLYGGTATDDMYLGAWGLLRARGERVPSLLPLPDNASPNEPTVANTPTATAPQPGGTPPGGVAPPEANAPGTPCPAGAPVKRYDVLAMQTRIEYNAAGDHDPFGLIYALAEDEAAVRAGTKEPEPLVLRANEGDCIEVRLTNKLTRAWLEGPGAHGSAGTNGDPTLPTEPGSGTPAGLRVSLHPQLVEYDVRGSDGTAVGFNRDQTVAPGDSRLYRWYADDPGRGEIGATNLTDLGDVRGHRHHGLFAGLNIEPKGSTYHDPQTGEAIRSGASADIRVPGAPDFREFTTFFQDGLSLHDESGPIEDPLDHPPTPEEPEGEGMDAEDMGEKGFNYSNAPFSHRLPAEQMGPDGLHPLPHDSRAMADVFSSKVHGDPDTPIFRAFAGDDIRMRVLQGSDKPRQHSFQVSGASWRAQPNDPRSNVVGTQGGISVGQAFNMHLSGFDSPGDYRYGTGVSFTHISGGLWGMVRVYPNQPAKAALSPTPLRTVDNPLTLTNHPILPLEVFRTETKLSLNAQPDRLSSGQATKLTGKLVDAKGRPAANMPVVLMQKPEGSGSEFTRVATAKTRDTGAYTFAGVKVNRTTDYVVRFAGNIQKGLSPSASPVKRVVVKGA